MYKYLFLLCLVVVASAQENQDLNSLEKSILGIVLTFFNAPPIKQHTSVQPVSKPQDSKYQTCMTDDHEEGQCVPFYLCETSNTVITEGGGINDIRFRAIKCTSHLEVCCKIQNTLKEIPYATDQHNQKKGCGWRNPDGIGFKTRGDTNGKSVFGEFPWMVAILKIEPVTGGIPLHIGGGSLIHPSVVLTTAHYVVNTTTMKIRAGEWDTRTKRYPFQDRDVASKIIHKNFNSGNLIYDMALLFLSSPVDTTFPNVGLACLAPPRQRTEGGKQCIANGWGKDKFGKDGKYQVILKKVTVPVVERQQCQTQLRQTSLGQHFELHPSFMCAGGEAGIDTCTGDGGSPLICPIENEPNRYMQSGMVAWGIGCGEEGTPGVYVDVSYLRYWIDYKVDENGFDPKTYSF